MTEIIQKPIRLLELFGGIGACSAAFERLGIPYEIVDYVEIDKYAVKSYNAIHGTNFEPQDITQWDKDVDVDFIMHGSPCQDFSIAGQQAGGDKGSGTRSSLMYETVRIVEKLKPTYVLWENVANMMSDKHRHNFDAYWDAMEKMGYRVVSWRLNAKDYGVPQNRVRIYTLSVLENQYEDEYFAPPKKRFLNTRVVDLLEENVDEKFYLSNQAFQTAFSKNEDFMKILEDRQRCVSNANAKGPLKYINENMESSILRYERNAYGKSIRKKYEAHQINEKRGAMRDLQPRKDGLSNTITTVQKDNYLLEPYTTTGNTIAGCIRSTIYKQGARNLILSLTEKRGYEGIVEPKLEFLGGIGAKDWAGDGKKLSRNFPQEQRVYDAKGLACSQTAQGGASEAIQDFILFDIVFAN